MARNRAAVRLVGHCRFCFAARALPNLMAKRDDDSRPRIVGTGVRPRTSKLRPGHSGRGFFMYGPEDIFAQNRILMGRSSWNRVERASWSAFP